MMNFCVRYFIWVALSIIFFPLYATLHGESFKIDGVNFIFRVPAAYNENSRIIVLFGGRNWPGEKTLKTYGFNDLADQHHLFLIAPSFKDREYWEPSKWSGEVLKKALVKLEEKYNLKTQKIYFYGYSAGAQCAALFFAWMPERVAAWGVHACGVYPEKIEFSSAPALVTCGFQDEERFQISRHFIYRYREAGGFLLWKPFPGRHELSPFALELARTWFDAVLSGEKIAEYGEDDTKQIKNNIDIEFRNPLYNSRLRSLWLK